MRKGVNTQQFASLVMYLGFPANMNFSKLMSKLIVYSAECRTMQEGGGPNHLKSEWAGVLGDQEVGQVHKVGHGGVAEQDPDEIGVLLC
jgi:hypothetical protein